MTKKNLLKLKSVVTRAIKTHIKNGGTLLAGDFYLPAAPNGNEEAASKCKCPIELVINPEGRQSPVTSNTLSKILKFPINRDEMYAFIAGFDKRKNNWSSLLEVSKEDYAKLYKLGREVRKQFKVLTKPQINKIMGYEYV